MAKENEFIQKVYDRYYAQIRAASVPLNEANFARYGVSTTPTIVLVDSNGLVRLYHPGLMDEATLKAAIEPLVARPAGTRAAASARVTR